MAGNPFYIQPASVDTKPVLSGIGNIVSASREAQNKQAMQKGFQEAYASNDPDQLAAFVSKNPEMRETIMSSINFKNKATENNYAEFLQDFLANPTRENFAEMTEARSGFIKGQGGDSSGIDQALALYDENPEIAVTRTEQALASLFPNRWKGYREQQGGVNNEDFLKEERKNASQDVRSFNKEAKQMRTDFGTLKGLAKQAEGGDRGARNAMVVSLARLVSPGIVTEKEASALSGGQNTMQYVLGILKGKSPTAVEGLERYIDPYGDSFDTNGLLNVGKSVVTSSRKPLIDAYEASRDRATRAGMSPSAFNTNFGSNPNYDFLKSFGEDSTKAVDLSSMSLEDLQALRAEAAK